MKSKRNWRQSVVVDQPPPVYQICPPTSPPGQDPHIASRRRVGRRLATPERRGGQQKNKPSDLAEQTAAGVVVVTIRIDRRT